MASLAFDALSSASLRSKAFASEISQKAIKPQDGGIYGGISAPWTSMQTASSQALQFYRANRDVQYTATHPIANRFAQQPVRVAISPRRSSFDSPKLPAMVKSLRKEGFISETYEKRQKEFRDAMPKFVKSTMPPDAVVVDSHYITEAFARPNAVSSDFDTMYMVAASLLTAGAAVLVWDETNETAGVSGIATPGVYYTPMSWLTPNGNHSKYGWTCTPPSGGGSYNLEPGEYIYVGMADPEDPFGALSPMRAMARTINTGDKISDVHYHSLENLMRPSYAIELGRMPGVDGKGNGPRIKLDKDMRTKLVNALRRQLSGAGRRGDPVVLDAYIEKITDLGSKPTDLDYAHGEQMIRDRIMQGFGTSPVMAGHVTPANKASAVVAQELFYDLLVNPMAVRVSRALTHTLGPKYSTDDYVVTVYVETPQIDDPEAVARRVTLFRDRLSDEEVRRYLRTGKLEIDESDMTFREEQQAREQLRANRQGPGTQNA